MLSMLRKLINNQRGSVAVLMALGLGVFLGMGAIVTDTGLLFLNKSQITTAADAAVLAGIQDLPTSPEQAVTTASSYAVQNGLASDRVGIQTSNNDKTLIVSINRSVNLLFAKIFDLTSSNVSAATGATLVPISSATGVVPFGVVWQNFQFGEQYQLKVGAGDGGQGNFGALALGGNGASVYRDNVKHGYDGKLSVGQWITTETGNMSGPTGQGVNYRMSLDPNATYATVKKGSSRIIIIPVLHSLDVNGRNEVLIDGFAAFFLEGVGGQGNDCFVNGRFMEMVVPNSDISTSNGDYGAYGYKVFDGLAHQ